jgi:hypothetical protein
MRRSTREARHEEGLSPRRQCLDRGAAGATGSQFGALSRAGLAVSTGHRCRKKSAPVP